MFIRSKQLIIFLCLAVSLQFFGVGPASAGTHDESVHKSTVAKYYCPMHPQVTSDKPGECPICHMRLVPNDMAAGGETGSKRPVPLEGRIPVKIGDPARNTVGIKTETVRTMPLKKTLEVWGTVAHDPELYEMQIQFLREERVGYERDRDLTPLAQKRGLTPREKIRLEFLKRGLSQEWVKALDDAGVPDKRLVYHNEADGLWVYAMLREKDAPLVKVGDSASISASTLPGLKLTGRVEFIDGMVDQQTKTVRAHVLVKGAPSELKPNASVSVSIPIDLGEATVAPEDALLFSGNKALVFVDQEGTFKPREVVLGPWVDGFYEIKSGLMPGEKIASSGNFFIDSESRLRSSLAGAGEGAGS